MVFGFERDEDKTKAKKHRYEVDLPVSVDMEKYLPQQEKKTRYSLSTVIKYKGQKLNERTHITFTKMGDGQWWRCDAGTVWKAAERDVQGGSGGETCLAFYKRDA
ncbi:hypothetical protein BDV95DRAFT_601628 [Massariosphaeria phaeospora]|uniref:USP domain-containing protein n=1 Tax=Massariosphaeria phaeospora TaxID=100035 RepID=A0A7C8IHD5_9PLEO|nr:hypothetical protein BDV95DRAFT_601628 [Massariosphaeria phaeospora]